MTKRFRYNGSDFIGIVKKNHGYDNKYDILSSNLVSYQR